MEALLNIIIYGSLALSFTVTFFTIDKTVQRIDRRTKKLEMCLDLILNKLELEIPSSLSDRAKELARNPQTKIAAIKLHRAETGVSLKEALKDVDNFIAQNYPDGWYIDDRWDYYV